MALVLKQQVKLTQQLLMTPQLQQAIKLLQLSRLELVDTLRHEIEQNPMLEEAVSVEADYEPGLAALAGGGEGDAGSDPAALAGGEKTAEVSMESTTSMEEINWNDYNNHYESGFSFSFEAPDPNRPTALDFVSKKPNLYSHLQWQLSHAVLSDQEKEIGQYIIGSLDRHGFLEPAVEEVARETGSDEAAVRGVLAVIQDMEPAGVAARDIKESLLIQLDRRGLTDSLAATIITDYLSLLETKKYSTIAKAVGRPVDDVVAAVKIIVSLNPYPATLFSDEDTQYIVPDVYIHKVGEEYVIILNDEDLPRLQLSSAYQEMLRNGGSLNGDSLDAEAKGYLQEKTRDALWLIKSMQQRQRTIYKVMESLLKFQHDFFEHGISQLKPLILRDVAEDIDMHESTVSRVTSNKYVHTPQGIFELKYFFSTAIERQGGESLAAESIRDRIRTMIKQEDSAKPLTDNDISDILTGEDIKVARRTVAKYREQLGILPVKFRRAPKLK